MSHCVERKYQNLCSTDVLDARLAHHLRFRGGLVFKAHRLCVALNSRLQSNEEEEKGVCVHLEVRERSKEHLIFPRVLREPAECCPLVDLPNLSGVGCKM